MKRAALTLVLALPACSPRSSVDEPTWVDDVRPILVANCVRCHQLPPLYGAPDKLRFDLYGDEDLNGNGLPDNYDIYVDAAPRRDASTVPDAGPGDPDAAPPPPRPDAGADTFYGAGDLADRIAINTKSGYMPLNSPKLVQWEIDILAKWAALKPDPDHPPPRGTPRRGNELPTMRTSASLAVQDGKVVFEYEIDDPDFDLVVGTLWATPAGGGDRIFIRGDLRDGRRYTQWTTAGVAAGAYDISADLDDGIDQTTIDLGQVTVP